MVIEDLDVAHKVLGHHLKIWADPWAKCTGEIKGSSLPLTYDVLIVTSNYHPSDIW